MQQRSLRHLPYNLPQFRLLHPIFREREHHAWIYVGADFLREDIFEAGIPYCGGFVGADSGDDAAGVFG